MEKMMKRRQFLKMGMCGLAAAAVGSTGLPLILQEPKAHAANVIVNLNMIEVLVEMIDLTQVFMWSFEDANGPHIPGPLISAQQGDTLNITITNTMNEPHAFAIAGVASSGVINPGQTKNVIFQAPPPGSYLYLDPLNAPVNRMMGLHGVLVVMPTGGNTPYTNPTPQVQALFNDLGTAPAFPGSPWNPARTFIWVFNQIDPFLNNFMLNNPPLNPATFTRNFLPRYFTINGKSGYFSSHDPSIAPHGHVGQPALIRNVNVGLVTHSPHNHANHVYVLSVNGRPQNNVFLVDTWSMRPLDRKDVLLPFIRPPDIPPAVWPPVEEAFPLMYPMHCHMEMSQTSGGGNYPQGLVTDWVIEGDLI
jgi:FtsP/CotA-like multicopper oxidase with cupredoxin domain